jgi:hypothetical protein
MAYYSGQSGELYIDGAKAAKVQNWSFTSSQEVLDTVSLGDTDKTSIAGLRTLSGQCRLFYYQDSPGSGGDATKLLSKCMKAGSGEGDGTAAVSCSAKLKLRVADGSTNGRYIEFYCWLTSVSMSMAIGEVFSADVNFEANGAPTGVVI